MKHVFYAWDHKRRGEIRVSCALEKEKMPYITRRAEVPLFNWCYVTCSLHQQALHVSIATSYVAYFSMSADDVAVKMR